MSDVHERPYIPPHWPKAEPFPWPEWEMPCPGCGRFHRNYHIVSGESSRCAWCDWICAWCDWMGDLAWLDRDREGAA